MSLKIKNKFFLECHYHQIFFTRKKASLIISPLRNISGDDASDFGDKEYISKAQTLLDNRDFLENEGSGR